jgi:hypothetical protein
MSLKVELDALKTWMSGLPEVSSGPHRFGGTEFKVEGLEFMHFHGDTYMDIHLSKEDQTRMLNERKAEHHQFAPEAGWVTVKICCEKDLQNPREVIQLAYSRAKRIKETHIARRGKTKIS